MSEEIVLSRVLPLLFFLIGVGLLIKATLCTKRTFTFLGRAIETTGEVVALEEEPATDPAELNTYRPVVSFQIGQTQRITFKSFSHSNPPQYKIGDSVCVLYLSENPHDARIRSFINLWLLSYILGGLGLVFTFLGAGLLLGYIPV